MAKAKTSKTTKKAIKATETETLKAVELARKGALAYVGLHVVAFEEAKTRLTKFRAQRNDFVDTLVARGETLETQATVLAKKTQIKASEQFAETKSKVNFKLPFSANDRVEELEAEITALNKKISAMAKKTAKPGKKAAMKTERKVKKAAPKAA